MIRNESRSELRGMNLDPLLKLLLANMKNRQQVGQQISPPLPVLLNAPSRNKHHCSLYFTLFLPAYLPLSSLVQQFRGTHTTRSSHSFNNDNTNNNWSIFLMNYETPLYDDRNRYVSYRGKSKPSTCLRNLPHVADRRPAKTLPIIIRIQALEWINNSTKTSQQTHEMISHKHQLMTLFFFWNVVMTTRW